MRRRDFITGIAVSAAAWPLSVRAQQSERMRRLGVLMNGDATDAQAQLWLAAFVQGLRQLGWVESQNLRMEIRWNAGDTVLARTHVAELVGLMPDVILAVTTISLEVALQATNTIPSFCSGR